MNSPEDTHDLVQFGHEWLVPRAQDRHVPHEFRRVLSFGLTTIFDRVAQFLRVGTVSFDQILHPVRHIAISTFTTTGLEPLKCVPHVHF